MRHLAALSVSANGLVLYDALVKERDGEIAKALEAARNQSVDLVAEARGMARASAFADVIDLLRTAQDSVNPRG